MSEFPASLRPFQDPSVWAKEFGKHKVAAVLRREGKQVEIVAQATNIYTF